MNDVFFSVCHSDVWIKSGPLCKVKYNKEAINKEVGKIQIRNLFLWHETPFLRV